MDTILQMSNVFLNGDAENMKEIKHTKFVQDLFLKKIKLDFLYI